MADPIILPEITVYWNRSFPGNNPMGGHPGSYSDAQSPEHSGGSTASGGAEGIISRPTAQQQGFDVAHDSVWQQRGPHPTVDQQGVMHMLQKIADSTKPQLYLNNKMGQSHKLWEIYNWAIKNLRPNVSPAGEAGYWGAAYHESTDGSIRDMLDGPKMFTHRKDFPDPNYKYYPMSPAFSVHPEDLSLDPTSTYWAADFTGADPNGRLLFDPTPVDPYGPPIPNLFDPPFQPSR